MPYSYSLEAYPALKWGSNSFSSYHRLFFLDSYFFVFEIYLTSNALIGYVNEYPIMHYIGTRRHTQSMIAYMILTKYFWKSQWELALHCGDVVNMPDWKHQYLPDSWTKYCINSRPWCVLHFFRLAVASRQPEFGVFWETTSIKVTAYCIQWFTAGCKKKRHIATCMLFA